MVTPVIMPKLGETMEEGKVVGWRRGEGDSVTKGDILFEVSTDKANFEVEAPASGVLLKILRAAGEEMVPVTSTIAWIGDSRDEKAPDAGASSTASPPGKAASMAAPAPKAMAPVPEGEGLKASPYARKLAAGKGVDITKITGTGPGGRIVEQDVLAAAGAGTGAASGMHPFEAEFALLEDLGVQMILREIDQKDVVLALHGAGRATVDIIFRNVSTRARKMIEEDLAALGSVRADSVEKARDTFLRVIRFLEDRGELVIRRGPGMVAPLAGIRKVAAERLTKAWREIPHFQLVRDIRMERCAALKKAAEGKGGKASYNAMVIKAVGVALREHPEFNAHYLPEGIRTLTEVNVGMAVGIKDGLVVPVVRDADKRSLAEVSLEASALMKKAVAGKLSLAEMSDGSFTVTNLGMHGIDSFTAIINPPQVGILAVGKVREAAVVEDGKVVPGLVMTVTLSADHRAVDGLRGALFLETVRKVLEESLDEAP
jgi:pyruvate dehydrogenase E2 component (dihydrolipoamide acetyltransferase)